MKKYSDEEVSKWNKEAQANRFCYESECKYYYPEIEQCMNGEPDVPKFKCMCKTVREQTMGLTQ